MIYVTVTNLFYHRLYAARMLGGYEARKLWGCLSLMADSSPSNPLIGSPLWKIIQMTFSWYIGLPHAMGRIMRFERSPLFRKTISPWYDSETFCVVVILLMVVVSLFSVCGLWVAHNHSEYNPHLWVPASLLLMCLYVILSISIRLVRRFSRQEDPYR